MRKEYDLKKIKCFQKRLGKKLSKHVNKFELQPTLTGELLSFRPLQSANFEDLYAVSSGPLIWEIHPEKYRYQRNASKNFFRAAIESKGALLASDIKTQEVLGCSRYSALNFVNSRIDIGYTFLSR
jgi:hypothetical protein